MALVGIKLKIAPRLSIALSLISGSNIFINSAKYEIDGGDTINVGSNGVQFVDLEDNSFIRFKRLNNFVLVEYHLNLLNNQTL